MPKKYNYFTMRAENDFQSPSECLIQWRDGLLKGNQSLKVAETTSMHSGSSKEPKRPEHFTRWEMFSVLILIRGQFQMELEDGSIPVNEGDIILIPPHVAHLDHFKPDPSFQVAFIRFNPESFRIYQGYGSDGGPWPLKSLVQDFPMLAYQNGLQLLLQTTELAKNRRWLNVSHDTFAAFLSMAKIICEQKPIPQQRQQLPELLKHALYLLESEGMDPLFSLSLCAQKVQCSPNHLSQLFSKHLEHGFSHTLLHHRLHEAKRMLSLKGTNVNEVAQRCGFNSTSYFIKKFKMFYQCTPHHYQKTF